MTRQFCDRCNADVTNKRSAAVTMVGDADVQGNGDVTTKADLCQRCRRQLEHWLSRPPTKDEADAAAERAIPRDALRPASTGRASENGHRKTRAHAR
jgi:hypothetical protein